MNHVYTFQFISLVLTGCVGLLAIPDVAVFIYNRYVHAYNKFVPIGNWMLNRADAFLERLEKRVENW
jgi:hypothetical protein